VSFEDPKVDLKAKLLARLEEHPHVRAVARELGINENTAAGWARKAGWERPPGTPKLGGGSEPHPRRGEYFELRRSGVSRRGAAQRVGVNIRTARDWDQGIRKVSGARVHPDGRRVDYRTGRTTMDPVTSLLAAVEKPLDPRFLSLAEREQIRDMRAEQKSCRAIAAALGRSPSTITREIHANSDPAGIYRPYAAQRSSAQRRARPKDRKLLIEGPLREFVAAGLRKRWSPEQICHALCDEFPHDEAMRVSHETIYQALYFQARGGLKKEVQAAIRTGRTRRKPHRDPAQRTSRFIDPMVMISERPAEVDDRAVPGHWEGDLITGAFNKTAIGTLVERTTRYVMLLHLPNGHTAEEVRDALTRQIQTLPEHLRGSLTWDQGAEMAGHKQFTMATNMPVYFCDPASPWQRGSNENTNGLLRQYFPKGTDLSVYGPEDLEHVAQQLNGRPRKTLGWKKPAERLRDLLTA
jgi:transposase, IS30 family